MVKWEYKTVSLVYDTRFGAFGLLNRPIGSTNQAYGIGDIVRDNQFSDGRLLLRQFDDWMNDFGLEGWESYSVQTWGRAQVVFLKRPIKD